MATTKRPDRLIEAYSNQAYKVPKMGVGKKPPPPPAMRPKAEASKGLSIKEK